KARDQLPPGDLARPVKCQALPVGEHGLVHDFGAPNLCLATITGAAGPILDGHLHRRNPRQRSLFHLAVYLSVCVVHETHCACIEQSPSQKRNIAPPPCPALLTQRMRASSRGGQPSFCPSERFRRQTATRAVSVRSSTICRA